MIFVCLFRNADFLRYLRPVLDSFLLMCSSLEPGITTPITSKVVTSEAESSAAQHLA